MIPARGVMRYRFARSLRAGSRSWSVCNTEVVIPRCPARCGVGADTVGGSLKTHRCSRVAVGLRRRHRLGGRGFTMVQGSDLISALGFASSLAEAVRVLTGAARRSRPRSDGAGDGRREPVDWVDFVTLGPECGGVARVRFRDLGGRPGSQTDSQRPDQRWTPVDVGGRGRGGIRRRLCWPATRSATPREVLGQGELRP